MVYHMNDSVQEINFLLHNKVLVCLMYIVVRYFSYGCTFDNEKTYAQVNRKTH